MDRRSFLASVSAALGAFLFGGVTAARAKPKPKLTSMTSLIWSYTAQQDAPSGGPLSIPDYALPAAGPETNRMLVATMAFVGNAAWTFRYSPDPTFPGGSTTILSLGSGSNSGGTAAVTVAYTPIPNGATGYVRLSTNDFNPAAAVWGLHLLANARFIGTVDTNNDVATAGWASTVASYPAGSLVVSCACVSHGGTESTSTLTALSGQTEDINTFTTSGSNPNCRVAIAHQSVSGSFAQQWTVSPAVVLLSDSAVVVGDIFGPPPRARAWAAVIG